MTNRAINKAIAEYLSWKELDFHLDGKRILGKRPSFHNGKIVSYTVDQYVPDYCGDLNEMHEAEKVLTYEQAELFEDELCDIAKEKNDVMENPLPWRFSVCHATASQRAKAFVKTIDKCKE